jgi:hypothetical protein
MRRCVTSGDPLMPRGYLDPDTRTRMLGPCEAAGKLRQRSSVTDRP